MKTFMILLALTLTSQVFADATIEVNFGQGEIRGEEYYGYEKQQLSIVCNNTDCSEVYVTKNGVQITRIISKRNFTLKTTDYGMAKEPWRADPERRINGLEFTEIFFSKEQYKIHTAFDVPMVIATPMFIALGAGVSALVLTGQEIWNLPQPGDLRIRRLKKDFKDRLNLASVFNKVSEAKEVKVSFGKFSKIEKLLKKQFPIELI